ncbi:MAG: DeoR/GlpR family DNA-binding transcription regulator [Actinomycetaceae bacterium]|nr:DeoR/GlpR family DNA-binding transcription regulator [Actinomycetaceae bacterium]
MNLKKTAPQTSSLDPESRRHKIMDHLVRVGSTHVEELAEILGVSAMTVYRDVAELERTQLVTRRRGEVTPAESSLTEASYRLRINTNYEVKTSLAEAARKYLTRGSSLMVDDSSSTIPLVSDLSDVAPITVITNAEFVAEHVRNQEGVRLLLVGGEYESWANSYFGDLAEVAIKQIHVDLCVMSTSALSSTDFYHPNENVARVKRAMLEVSRKKILLVDSSKFDRSALYKVGSNTLFDLIITDSDTPPEIIESLRDQGITVEVVPRL